MLKVLDPTIEDNRETSEGAVPTLDEVAREGARRMLMAALEAEVEQYIETHAAACDADGRRLVVRNGRAQSRKVTCGAGTMPVRAPRVNDRRVDDDGERQRFTSRILPPYMRRSPQVAEVLPLLYLRGLSTGDFREALPALLGKDAAGLSPTNITRLTAAWDEEYQAFRRRDLSACDYVYVWVDGIHFNIRLEEDRLCTLVMIGVTADGTKELVALEDGYRESTESWASVLRDLRGRGLRAPAVAVGDGALGFWSALRGRDRRHDLPEARTQLTRAAPGGSGTARQRPGHPAPRRRSPAAESPLTPPVLIAASVQSLLSHFAAATDAAMAVGDAPEARGARRPPPAPASEDSPSRLPSEHGAPAALVDHLRGAPALISSSTGARRCRGSWSFAPGSPSTTRTVGDKVDVRRCPPSSRTCPRPVAGGEDGGQVCRSERLRLSSAGLGSPARRARKHAAATAVEALARGSPLVVEFGEVGGEDRHPRAGGRRARRRAAGVPRCTPGGCSGRARRRAVGVGRSSAAAAGRVGRA